MTEASADFEAMMAEYASAVLAKDPARVAALYAPDVRVFDTWGIWSYDDQAAWSGQPGRLVGITRKRERTSQIRRRTPHAPSRIWLNQRSRYLQRCR